MTPHPSEAGPRGEAGPRRLPAPVQSRLALALLVLAVGEATWFTSRYDAGGLLESASPWSALLAASRVLLPAGVTILAAVLLLARRALPAELRARLREPAVLGRREGGLLLLHLAALAGFAALTERLLGGGGDLTALPTLAWTACGLACALALALLALPRGATVALGRESLGAGLLGVAVGLVAWGAGQTTDRTLWVALARPTLLAAAGLLRLAGVPAVASPDDFVLEASGFSVQIGVGCSGYEGIGLVCTFLSVYLWLFRRELRFPRALLLLPLGTTLVWGLNVARIALLVRIGTRSPELALGAFHARFGWVLFTALALGLAALGRHRAFRRASRGEPEGPHDAAVDHLAPLAVLAGAGLLLGSFVPAGSPFLALAMLAALACLLLLRRGAGEAAWIPTGRAVVAGALAFALWTATESRPDELVDWPARSEPLLRALAVLRVLGFVCVVPWVEELAFRGFLLRRLVAKDVRRTLHDVSAWAAVLGSSLLFGAVHERFVAASCAGLVYGLLYMRTRRLGEAVCAHGTTNALIALRVLLFP